MTMENFLLASHGTRPPLSCMRACVFFSIQLYKHLDFITLHSHTLHL
uniref:Uncharacterized protein n=1 Tax=Arundo donax TaxID=35708 RepID=A0A0A8ZLN5_ARUDO